MRRTHSLLPYNRTSPSSSSFCTSHNLLGYFFATFIRHPVFVFLEISVDNSQIHPLNKIHNHRSFLISCSSTVPPHYSSSPMFPLPTCPLRSAPRTIFSSFHTFFINPFRSSQKSFFSSMLLLICGAYVLIMFSIDPFISCLMAISLSDTLFTSKTLSASSSLTTISMLFFLPSSCRIVCIHLQCSSLYFLSTFFSVGTICLHSFAPSCLSTLFLFQSLFLYLRYQPLYVCVSPSTVPTVSSLAFLLSFSSCFH